MGVERELQDWEQWRDLVDSIEDGKSTPTVHQQMQQRTQSAGVMRRTSSNVSTSSNGSSMHGHGNGNGQSDWRACLSPVSLNRVTSLEASRDHAESSVEVMSAAMKELQQIERKATAAKNAAGGGGGGEGDSLEKWQQSIN